MRYRQHLKLLALHVCLTYESSTFMASALASPWAPAIWKLMIDLGSEEASTAPNTRIATVFEVEINSDDCLGRETFVGPGASRIIPSTEAKYVTLKGEEKIDFDPSGGGWTLEFPPGKQGRASKLRFWIDVMTPVTKNNDEIVLDAGRLFFMSNAWREDELALGLKKITPMHRQAQQAQEFLEERISHESGDRRLDGTNAIETLEAYQDMAGLVIDRDTKRQALKKALEIYPPPSIAELSEGPWPGAEEWLTISEKNPILVAEKPVSLSMGEQYRVVGSWKMEPVLSEDEFEVVDVY